MSTDPARRMQILSSEHASLLATRSLAWNESFSRAGMFLTTLSGSMVALALIAQATKFGHESILFALVILPVVLFIGVATMIRLGAANYVDASCVMGMNRIRAGYLEIDPELERYFVTSAHDDPAGISISMGGLPGRPSLANVLAATPTMISTINAVLTGVIAALIVFEVLFEVDFVVPVGAAAGCAVFVLALIIQLRWARTQIERQQATMHSIFPSDPQPAGAQAVATVKES
jgi:hypothetical protein